MTDPAGGVTHFEYDGLDQVTKITDPLGHATTYTVNGRGDLQTLASPDSGTTNRTHDLAGNVITSTDAKGELITYTYDALNRLLTSTGTTGPNTTRTYDPSPGVGQLASFVDRDASGSNVLFSASFTYDVMGRLTRKADSIDGKTFALEHTYDTSGRLATTKYPSGRIATLTYDPAGNVQSVSVDGQVVASTITYHPFGKPNGWRWPLQSGYDLETRAYDVDGRLANFTVGSPGVQRTVQYDAADRITGMTQAADVRTFTYFDSMLTKETERLYSFTGGGASHSYTYDANGNRTTRNTGSATDTYGYDPLSNKLTSINGVTVTADANGNTTNDGQRAFEYDGNQRMIHASAAGQNAQYYVNGYGQRSKKSVTAGSTTTVTYFTYDETGKLAGEYDGSGNALREYVYLGDLPLAVLANNEIYLIQANQIEAPINVRQSTGQGAVIWSWDPAPFGDSAGTLGLNEDVDNDTVAFPMPLRFPGQISDSETGLHYNYFRDCYDPTTGRFCQGDPIGLLGGINPYAFADDPLTQIDPQGLMGRASGAVGPHAPPIVATPAYVGVLQAVSIILPVLPFSGIVGTTSCGSYGFRAPNILDGAMIQQACVNHDICYETCGVWKDDCDRRLRDDIRKACGGGVRCVLGAQVYFAAVQRFGEKAFLDSREHCRHGQCK